MPIAACLGAPPREELGVAMKGLSTAAINREAMLGSPPALKKSLREVFRDAT